MRLSRDPSRPMVDRLRRNATRLKLAGLTLVAAISRAINLIRRAHTDPILTVLVVQETRVS